MLLAADVALPRRVWAHGYVQWSGTKMSKTAGTAVSLDGAIERHGADALRYFLLREIGFENDGNFSWDRFDARYTADLADTVGNLASRVLAMVQRYRDGVVPRDAGGYATPLETDARVSLESYARAMDALALEDGAAELVSLAARANRYVEETAPWTLAKGNRTAELDTVLANLARTVARLGVLAAPFMPEKAVQLWDTLGSGRPLEQIRFADVADLDPAGWTVQKPPPLFPKP
jgi:methionyl-tRNA synthetase